MYIIYLAYIYILFYDLGQVAKVNFAILFYSCMRMEVGKLNI